MRSGSSHAPPMNDTPIGSVPSLAYPAGTVMLAHPAIADADEDPMNGCGGFERSPPSGPSKSVSQAGPFVGAMIASNSASSAARRVRTGGVVAARAPTHAGD